MQLIFDNLIAVVVSAILLMTLMTVNLRSQESAVDATRFHAAKVKQAALINLVEYDFEDLGSGVPAGEQMITAYDADAFGMKVFAFRRELANAAGEPTIATVRYERFQTGTFQTADGAWVPQFRVARKVESTDGSMARSTGSGFDVIEFDVTLIGSDGAPVSTNLNDATSIEVALRMALPFQDDGEMHYMSWKGAYRPSNLALRAGATGGVGVGS